MVHSLKTGWNLQGRHVNSMDLQTPPQLCREQKLSWGGRKALDGNDSVSIPVFGLSEMSSAEIPSSCPKELESGLLAIIGFEKQITSDISVSVEV